MSTLGWAFLLCAVLAVALWGPFLWKEIRRGKANIGGTPAGEGDLFPGTRSNPAPGHPEAQADPYSPEAQRHAPPVKS
jgi:hypothetical protein